MKEYTHEVAKIARESLMKVKKCKKFLCLKELINDIVTKYCLYLPLQILAKYYFEALKGGGVF